MASAEKKLRGYGKEKYQEVSAGEFLALLDDCPAKYEVSGVDNEGTNNNFTGTTLRGNGENIVSNFLISSLLLLLLLRPKLKVDIPNSP